MSIVARLDEVLGPTRLSPAQRGVNVTFGRDGRWRTLHVVEAPHLEMSIAVPELAGFRLHVHLGAETVLGERAPVDDVRWRVKTDAPALAAAIFAEAPWPRRESDLRDAAWPGVTRVVARFEDLLLAAPPPLYVLEVERGVASIERRDGEYEPSRALGMVRRLVQLATWPDRALAGLRDLATRLGGELDGQRWSAGTSAITVRRGALTIRVDHEMTRGAPRTRIRVLDVAGAVAYVDGVGGDAESVGRAVDALLAQVARPATRGPYR